MQWSLGIKGALHCPGGAEMILWRRRRTQEHKCIGGSASSCGVLDRSISTVLSFESSTPGGACQISFTFSANVKILHIFGSFSVCSHCRVPGVCLLSPGESRPLTRNIVDSGKKCTSCWRNVLVVEEEARTWFYFGRKWTEVLRETKDIKSANQSDSWLQLSLFSCDSCMQSPAAIPACDPSAVWSKISRVNPLYA